MLIKDFQEVDQTATEVDNENVSMNHMLDLWKSDVLDAGISRRRTKLTEKGLYYWLELLWERRSKLHGKLLRKSSIIDEITYSWVNATAIREEMDQFSDTIKLFMSTHEEYQSLLTNENKPQIVNGMNSLTTRCLVLNTK